MNKFLANSHGQLLIEHLVAVALLGDRMLLELKINRKDLFAELRESLILSCLFHDLGKVHSSFQTFIKTSEAKKKEKFVDTDAESARNPDFRSKKEHFEGPFHNEISWAFISKVVEFRTDNIENIARFAVYWHHPANDNSSGKRRLGDSEKVWRKALDQDPLFVGNCVNLTKIVLDNFSSKSEFKVNPGMRDRYISEIGAPDFTQAYNQSKQKIVLHLLIEADRVVSSWSPEYLKDFIFDPQSYPLLTFANSEKSFSFGNDNSTERSLNQRQLVKQLQTKEVDGLSVCGVDPGAGKTSVALYWWQECKNKKHLMLTLPRQNQVTGLFTTIQKDAERIFDSDGRKKLKIEGIFNGRIQHRNWASDNESFYNSDISILVFDRFLSPCYERGQHGEFITMLNSHLVIDEFHEFAFLHQMRKSLKEVLTIRGWLGNGTKTILLSGTPNPALIRSLQIDPNAILGRNALPPVHKKPFKVLRKQKPIAMDDILHSTLNDCLYTFLTIRSAQEFCGRSQDIKLIHSQFTDNKKKELLEFILGQFRSPNPKQFSVSSSKMLQSSYDLNFSHGKVETSLPSTDCQTLGRINRHGSKSETTISFFTFSESERFFDENKFGFKDLHKEWNAHLNEVIGETKTFGDFREMVVTLFDDFWTSERTDMVASLLTRYENDALKYLQNWYPRRWNNEKATGARSTIRSKGFRGESFLLSAAKVDDTGCKIDQLVGDELLTLSAGWKIKPIREATQRVLKISKSANLKNSFNFTKYCKNVGFMPSRPFLCSHFEDNVDSTLARELKDQNLYAVYHPKYGLIDPELLSRF